MPESPAHAHHVKAQQPSMHWSQPVDWVSGGWMTDASPAPHENAPSSGTSQLPASTPELEPELPELPPEPLLDESMPPPELDPLDPPASPPASVPPLLPPDPEFEDEEQPFEPIVPMPPIANRHTQKASLFMSGRVHGTRDGAAHATTSASLDKTPRGPASFEDDPRWAFC